MDTQQEVFEVIFTFGIPPFSFFSQIPCPSPVCMLLSLLLLSPTDQGPALHSTTTLINPFLTFLLLQWSLFIERFDRLCRALMGSRSRSLALEVPT